MLFSKGGWLPFYSSLPLILWTILGMSIFYRPLKEEQNKQQEENCGSSKFARASASECPVKRIGPNVLNDQI